MPIWKNLALSIYYYTTLPVRACSYWREVAREQLPIAVLFYHRVADDHPNPWTVSNAMFLRQMRWLQRRFDFISLHDAQQRMRRGYNPQPCISITFDDGYAENCRAAIPWLIKHRIPCTYFVTLRNVLNDEPFQHDLARGAPLSPNTLEQLRAMASAGIEIGSHAYTHTDLGPVTNSTQLHRELAVSRESLQAAIGSPIRYFAFPYGQISNLNPEAFDAAKQAGYEGVCSAYGGFNFPGGNPFHLQRIPVDNDMIRMKNWVTLDPRKLHTRQFEYRGTENKERGASIAVNSNILTPIP